MPSYSLDFIAQHIGAELVGNCEQVVESLNTIQDATSKDEAEFSGAYMDAPR